LPYPNSNTLIRIGSAIIPDCENWTGLIINGLPPLPPSRARAKDINLNRRIKIKEVIELKEYKGLVTLKGNPVTLTGNEANVGDKAPDFEVLDNDLNRVKLSSFKGKVVVISAVPSLDTPVCDMETRRFNREAGKIGDDVVILTISVDLPFAQKRWCGAAGVENVVTLSDHREVSFGTSYGVLIRELRLLARVIFVIDREGVIKYKQVVREVAEEPDYDEVLKAMDKLMAKV